MPSELNAAYLWAQLENADIINNDRLKTWNSYNQAFELLQKNGKCMLPTIPDYCIHNAHMFYIKCKNLEERTAFINHMKDRDILCVFHYIPLHSAPAGHKYGRFCGVDEYTTKESEKLVRIPLFYGMKDEDKNRVIKAVQDFFG